MSAATTMPVGLKGFDCNYPVTFGQAKAFKAAGYTFAIRYLGRVSQGPKDLCAVETAVLKQASLALMAVQHVENEESWTPTIDKGRLYGATAAGQAQGCGLAQGTTIWLDLEGVDTYVPAEEIISYCNHWHDKVAAAGYQPGIYVGWHCGLSPEQLYKRLRFTRYWGAYNLNVDQYPAVRAICLKQRAAKADDVPEGFSRDFDVNTSRPDLKGDCATVDAPEGW